MSVTFTKNHWIGANDEKIDITKIKDIVKFEREIRATLVTDDIIMDLLHSENKLDNDD